jgi:hypothetical protein
MPHFHQQSVRDPQPHFPHPMESGSFRSHSFISLAIPLVLLDLVIYDWQVSAHGQGVTDSATGQSHRAVVLTFTQPHLNSCLLPAISSFPRYKSEWDVHYLELSLTPQYLQRQPIAQRSCLRTHCNQDCLPLNFCQDPAQAHFLQEDPKPSQHFPHAFHPCLHHW